MDKKEFLNSLSADERKELIAEMQQREKEEKQNGVYKGLTIRIFCLEDVSKVLMIQQNP